MSILCVTQRPSTKTMMLRHTLLVVKTFSSGLVKLCSSRPEKGLTAENPCCVIVLMDGIFITWRTGKINTGKNNSTTWRRHYKQIWSSDEIFCYIYCSESRQLIFPLKTHEYTKMYIKVHGAP